MARWFVEWEEGVRMGLVGPIERRPSIYPGMTYPHQERIVIEDLVQMAKDAARYRYLRDFYAAAICEALFCDAVSLDEAPAKLDAFVDEDQ